MNDNKNDKQITKSQIELLKQKYLRKTIAPSPTQESKEQTNESIREYQPQRVTPIIEKRYSLNQTLASPGSKGAATQIGLMEKQTGAIVNCKQDRANEESVGPEFNLRKFMEQKQEVGKKQKKQKQGTNQLEDVEINIKDPFNLKIPFHYLSSQTVPQQKDPEFIQDKHLEAETNIKEKRDEIKKSDVRDLDQACKLWLSNPRKALVYTYFSNLNIDIQESQLKLTSRNPNFPGIVQQLAEHFIFNTTQPLKENQKQVVYNMALQYFSPSPEYLSDVLLVSLIKMSPTYASIYVDEIIRKMGYYVEKIIELKKYIIKQELDSFAKVVEERMESLRVDGHRLPDSCFIWLLILRPNSNYCNQILLVRNIANEKDLLAIFCALYPEGKQNSLSILYLKCIDALASLFIRAGILEKVISHLNEIKVPEALYQPIKSLKLKLIRAADTKKDRKKTEDDRGFTVFLNQKIGRFKQALQSKISIKIKPTVYFDPTSGLYQPNVASSPSR